MRTEEEKKEASRIASAKHYAKNKEAKKKYRAKYSLENKEAIKEYHAKYRAEARTHFVVYKHTNSKGQIYIGCGSNLRPYDFNNRKGNWKDAFKDDCQIHVVAEFKDKESARELEKLMIEYIGLDNLVNKKH